MYGNLRDTKIYTYINYSKHRTVEHGLSERNFHEYATR